MKLENCGRCGHSPAMMDAELVFCRCCGEAPDGGWNTAQRRIRTERINAAALALMAGYYASSACGRYTNESAVEEAALLVDAQDAAAQARFAKAQGGE